MFWAYSEYLQGRQVLVGAEVLQEEDSGILPVLWHRVAPASTAAFVPRRLFKMKNLEEN